MNTATIAPEFDYTIEQLIELAQAANEESTPWETFNDEIDAWARQALAANGFGDY